MSTHAPRILIVDNDERIVRAIASRLENLGYECETACCGTEGLEGFRRQPHDLVITDLNMPAGDGIGLTEAVRALSPVPIIVITGFEAAYRPRLDQFENIAVLQKPFDTTDLIDLVEAELVMAGCSLP
ncbi:MAG: response regulator [Planctomycetes bacterium]|nr:response regulator [Planctomycetota bacterium]